MTKTALLFAAALALVPQAAVRADQNATYHGALSASENAFVSSLSADLMRRYPTANDAEKAGYVRYTGEDETGAISYANVHQWQSGDIRHPSQLWYDKNGLLLGADYSVLVRTNPARPRLWGVNAGRWVEFDGHVHWVVKNPATGRLSYDHWATDGTFSAAGGNPENPGAATLVAMKKVASAREVVAIFHFPSIWDLIVWVKPNPKGAFAESNPLVTP